MKPKKPLPESLPRKKVARSKVASPARKGRPRLDEMGDKRAAIIGSTRALMKTTKPASITRDAVARHAGVDPALIRYYFGDRAALFREVIWETTNELHAKLISVEDSPSSVIDRLQARLLVWFEVFVSNPHYSELVVENVFYGDKREASEMLKVFVQRALPDVEKLVAEGIAKGEIKPVEPRFVYLTLIALAEYYATAAPLVAELFGSRDAVAKQAPAYCRYAADMMIEGLRARPSPKRS